MYLVLFSIIVLYKTIVTVCTDDIFLHNYLQQMHQIIHLSPVGCFTPARGKTKEDLCIEAQERGKNFALIIKSSLFEVILYMQQV